MNCFNERLGCMPVLSGFGMQTQQQAAARVLGGQQQQCEGAAARPAALCHAMPGPCTLVRLDRGRQQAWKGSLKGISLGPCAVCAAFAFCVLCACVCGCLAWPCDNDCTPCREVGQSVQHALKAHLDCPQFFGLWAAKRREGGFRAERNVKDTTFLPSFPLSFIWHSRGSGFCS